MAPELERHWCTQGQCTGQEQNTEKVWACKKDPTWTCMQFVVYICHSIKVQGKYFLFLLWRWGGTCILSDVARYVLKHYLVYTVWNFSNNNNHTLISYGKLNTNSSIMSYIMTQLCLPWHLAVFYLHQWSTYPFNNLNRVLLKRSKGYGHSMKCSSVLLFHIAVVTFRVGTTCVSWTSLPVMSTVRPSSSKINGVGLSWTAGRIGGRLNTPVESLDWIWAWKKNSNRLLIGFSNSPEF